MALAIEFEGFSFARKKKVYLFILHLWRKQFSSYICEGSQLITFTLCFEDCEWKIVFLSSSSPFTPRPPSFPLFSIQSSVMLFISLFFNDKHCQCFYL